MSLSSLVAMKSPTFKTALFVTAVTEMALFGPGVFIMYFVLGYPADRPLPVIVRVSEVLGGLSILGSAAFAITRRPRAAAGILSDGAIGLAAIFLGLLEVIFP